MKMEEINKNKPGEHGDTILVARFTMVARDALTGKAAQVNPLLLQNDAEKKLFQMGEGTRICFLVQYCQLVIGNRRVQDINELYLSLTSTFDTQTIRQESARLRIRH